MSRYWIEPLQASHAVEGFDCGEGALNRFLIRFSLANQGPRASRTYVALAGEVVVGFHTLVVGEVSPEQAPERIHKGLARHPIPLMVLARLAVAVDHQGQGLGAALLKDAICRTLAAAEIAGIRALAVHAKDERAHGFYAHFGFRSSPTDPLHLFVLLKDLQTFLPIIRGVIAAPSVFALRSSRCRCHAHSASSTSWSLEYQFHSSAKPASLGSGLLSINFPSMN